MLTTENKLKINIKDSLISNEKLIKLVGVIVDYKLSFDLKTPCTC